MKSSEGAEKFKDFDEFEYPESAYISPKASGFRFQFPEQVESNQISYSRSPSPLFSTPSVHKDDEEQNDIYWFSLALKVLPIISIQLLFLGLFSHIFFILALPVFIVWIIFVLFNLFRKKKFSAKTIPSFKFPTEF